MIWGGRSECNFGGDCLSPVADREDEVDMDEIERILYYRFHSRSLPIRALTRFQYAKEKHDKLEACDDQLLLATLGDAILKAALTDIFFKSGYENSDQVTKTREKIEKKEPLARRAKELGIGKHIILGHGEKKQQVQEEERVLAETLEALIAAIYLDSDFERTSDVVARLFEVPPLSQACRK